jgi:quercetin dioxygenase-like cupin family protein
MKIADCSKIPTTPVSVPGAVGATMCCLIGPDDGAPSFSMRHFELAPGGCTAHHTHGYEHEVFILSGQGVAIQGESNAEHPIGPGVAIYVAPNEVHQFRNTGSAPMRFICLIPHPLRGMSGTCVAACGCQ